METLRLPELASGGSRAPLSPFSAKSLKYAMNFDLETGSAAPASKSRSLITEMDFLRLPELASGGRERPSGRSALEKPGNTR